MAHTGLGVLSVIAGIVVLARPGDSLKTIAVITGIFVVIDGLVRGRCVS